MGIGSVFASITQGANDYQDKLESKRLKNLEFVRTVMRDNPDMKAADLLKLRNQLAGNSQFLSEAMPDQLMESYAQRAADARADEDLRREINGIEANKKRDEYYLTLAPDLMGGEDDDTTVVTKMRDILPESARPDFDKRFVPRFSGARKNWATQQAESAIIKMNQMGFDWGNEAGIEEVIKGLPAAARPYAKGLISEKKAAYARQREDQDRRWNQEADLRQKQWDKELETRRLQNERDDRIRKENQEREDRNRAETQQKAITDAIVERAKPLWGDISLDDNQRRDAIKGLVDTYTSGIPGVKIDPAQIYDLGRTEVERVARQAQEKQNQANATQNLNTLEASFEQNKKVFGSKENLDTLRKSVDSDVKDAAVSALGVLLGETHPSLMPNLNAWIKEAASKGLRTSTDIIGAIKARPDYQTYQNARTALSTSTSTIAPLTSKPVVETAAQDAPKIGSLATELGSYAIGPDADPARVTKSKALLLKSVNENIANLERLKVQNQRGVTAITSHEDLNAQLAEQRRLLGQINAIPVPSAPAAKTAAKAPAQTSSTLPVDPVDPEMAVVPTVPIGENSEILREAKIALEAITRNPAGRDKILRQVARTTTIPVDELEEAIRIIQGG